MFEKISRREFIKTAALTTFAFAATNFFDRDANAAKTCTARTRYGIYNGFVGKRGVQTWLGIPYAKPPVGALRWHAPEKLEPSNKTFDAKKFGASPIQDHDPIEPASLLEQSEDCLTLNIFTRGAAKNLPVMVYIPGGGFVNGGSADPLYNGTNPAAAHDVVVVTINYRLNIFGFMHFASIDSSFEDSGYLGIKDQVAALTWVKENIEHFGGDPDNVTIFGESAGSISAMLLSVTSAAQGLFGKAIAESGHLSFYHEPQYSAELADAFMALSGCKKMAELTAKPAAELEQIYEKFCAANPLVSEVGFLPTCDGKFLPKLPFKALKDGAGKGIKLLTGTTHDEYGYWSLYYKNFMNTLPEKHAGLTSVVYAAEGWKLDDVYAVWKKNHAELAEDKRYFEFTNQLDWRVGQELCAEYQSAFDDVYFYLFSQKASVNDLGSCHAVDLPFVFGNPSPDIEPHPSAKLVKQVQAAWASFAATGNPNNALIPQWTPYTAADRQTMEINSKAWACHKDLNADNLKALRGVYEENLLGTVGKQ